MSKKVSQNMSNELTKSRTAEPKRKISIRLSMNEKGANREGTFKKVDMSEIQMIDMEEDKSDLQFLLQKMNKQK